MPVSMGAHNVKNPGDDSDSEYEEEIHVTDDGKEVKRMKRKEKRTILRDRILAGSWLRVDGILGNMSSPQLAQKQISENEFKILWEKAPLRTIRLLLKVWPEAYGGVDPLGLNLVTMKCFRRDWDMLKTIVGEFPDIVSAADVEYSIREREPPIDLFEMMLDQVPSAPEVNPEIPFILIEKESLEHFRAVLGRNASAVDVKDCDLHLTPLLMIFQDKSKIQSDWIGSILSTNPNAARARDYDGKCPLHLAYQHGAPSDIVDIIRKAYPDAENERDNLGRTPQDLAADKSERLVFTPIAKVSILWDHDLAADETNSSGPDKRTYPEDAVVLCRGDMLMRDLPLGEDKKNGLQSNYSKQILTRHSIFETLLSEFVEKVQIKDKDVIQKAATIQAFAAKCLSQQDNTIVDFGIFDNPGYWYQQEMLKLVMRVFHESQVGIASNPSIYDDAEVCLRHLERRKNGERSPTPSEEHIKAFEELINWITEGLDQSLYLIQGPVLKPLQSLFNKLFIRRGQTSVHIIGDMVRATVLVEDKEGLQKIINRIETTFPNITENNFRHPDAFDRTVDFLHYVNDTLKFIPNSKEILPHRFKMNSSQKNKDEPLWFNFNFFIQIPEYYRIGQTEMFTACELQIGLTSEIKAHRKIHDAYERDRILSNQPLLQKYDDNLSKRRGVSQKISPNDEDALTNSTSTASDEDVRLIEKVLFGRVGSEVLIPSSCLGTRNNTDQDDENTLWLESGPFSLSSVQDGNGNDFLKRRPTKLCINNRTLNRFALEGRNILNKYGLVVAGPYRLDGSKRYFVDSLVMNGITGTGFTVGLYAHVGPFLVQIASYAGSGSAEMIVVVENGQNYTFLEQVCPIPAGTIAVELIAYGFLGGFGFENMALSLKEFDVA